MSISSKINNTGKCIGIVGSRRRNSEEDFEILVKIFSEIYEPGDTIVSGGCYCGADKMAEQISQDFNAPIKIHKAEWDKYGLSAGIKRNTYIAEDCDVLLAVVAPDRTGGTEDTIKKAKRLNKEVILL